MIGSWKINEISKEAVPIKWFYKNEGEWYGTFKVDDIEYDCSFIREDKKYNLDYTVVSFKFARPDKEDPYAFSVDFNKPLVIQNIIIKEIKSYIQKNKIDVFIIKAYSKEKTRVNRYRKFTHSLLREFGFIFENEIKEGKYTYFCLFRNKQAFIDKNKIINNINENQIINFAEKLYSEHKELFDNLKDK